jgi:hypothetical protein
VSYKSREKKRKAKIAVANAKREHRNVMETRYYLTLTKRPASCSARGCRLRVGDEMVYRHNGQVTLCVKCADSDPHVDYRTSLRWEQQRARSRKRGAAAASGKLAA